MFYILKDTNTNRISHEDRIQLKKLCRKLKLIDKNMTLVGIKYLIKPTNLWKLI